VATDVRALLSDDSILNASAPETFRAYNTDQMLQVKSPGHDHEFLITTYAELADGEYLDHRGKQVVAFDHIKQQATGARPVTGADYAEDLEPIRAALEDQSFAYATEHFPHGAAAVYCSKDDGQRSFTVCISASRFQGANYVNGRWRSTWAVSCGAQTKLQATIRLHVHYYEDGNVQLNTDFSKTLPIAANPQNAVAFAQEVFKVIHKTETDFQNQLEQSYNQMSESTFKALRRILPITKERINWQKIHTMNLGKEAGGIGANKGGAH